MKKIFIAVIFLFACLLFIFFYKKLFLVPASVIVPVQNFSPALTENLDTAFDKDTVLDKDIVLDNDITPDKDTVFDKNVAPAFVIVPVQNFSPTLAQEPDIVLDKDITPDKDTVLDKNLASASVIVPVQNFSPTLAQEPDIVLDQEIDNKETRTITIKNNITADMLKYAHWTGTYSPTSFTVNIDNSRLEAGQERAINIKNNRLVVDYQYVFMNGYKKGHRVVTFDVDKDAAMVNLTFSWKTKWHILSEQASPIQVEEVTYK